MSIAIYSWLDIQVYTFFIYGLHPSNPTDSCHPQQSPPPNIPLRSAPAIFLQGCSAMAHRVGYAYLFQPQLTYTLLSTPKAAPITLTLDGYNARAEHLMFGIIYMGIVGGDDGNNGHAGLHGQVECTFLEG